MSMQVTVLGTGCIRAPHVATLLRRVASEQ